MAGNVKEEHYKIVYAHGGTLKPEGEEQETMKNNQLRKPSPGAMYNKGGDTEEYEEGGEVEEKEKKSDDNEPQILATHDGKAVHTSKAAYREAKVINEDEEGVTVQIPKSLIPFIPMSVGLNYSDYNKYGFGKLLNQAQVDKMHVPKEVFGEGAKDTTYVTASPLKHRMTKGKPLPPAKRDEEEMLKKRLGGGIGYSYKNQQYQTPKGDNFAVSNRKANGESFSDKITGMGE